MEKITRYRNIQTKTIDDFIEDVLKKPSCKYCSSYEDCKEIMGPSIEADKEKTQFDWRFWNRTGRNLAQLRYIIERKDAKIKSLEMENELMRDFLSLTGRK